MGSWSANGIPEDLWREILSRIPVKSLLRFRCVSKSWRSLIADPDFWFSHQNSCVTDRRQTQLFIILIDLVKPEYVVKFYNTSETTTVLATAPLPAVSKKTTFHGFDFPGNWMIMSFTNGLCLLKDHTSKELMLWNPSIRKLRSVPPSPEISHEMTNIDMGLGFDPSTKDYKVVRLLGQFQNNRVNVYSIAVYSVMTDSWKLIQFSSTHSSDWHWYISHHHDLLGIRTVSFRGYLCFAAKNVYTNTNAMVFFDMRREVFGSTHLPDDGTLQHHQELVVVNGECRCVNYDYWIGKGSIWVLEGCEGDFEAVYWKRLCSFRIEMPTWFGIVLRNGDLLLHRGKVAIRYNAETLEEKILADNCDEEVIIRDVYEYSESMVLFSQVSICA